MMDCRLNGRLLLNPHDDERLDADYVVACALTIFEDYLSGCSAKEFAKRFGERGTRALARFTD